jgi:hypothetical protein
MSVVSLGHLALGCTGLQSKRYYLVTSVNIAEVTLMGSAIPAKEPQKQI